MTPRYAYWLAATNWRLRCPAGHEFTPELRLRSGHADITCRGGSTASVEPCGILLLILVVPRYNKRLVAEVSTADLAYMAAEAMRPETELAYLLSTPVRGVVASSQTGA